MNHGYFEQIKNELVVAENACIGHLVELMCRPEPSWNEIKHGYELAAELNRSLHDVVDALPLCPWEQDRDVATQLCQHCALTHAQSLHSLDQAALECHRCS